MSNRLGMTLLLSALGAATLHAQAPVQAVADAMIAYSGGKYAPPKCSADKGKHFLVSSAATYLKSAIEARDVEKRNTILGKAQDNAAQAITQNGQDKSASAWYFLGRVQLTRGDVAGADSSLARAQKFGPDCEAEITQLRRVAFAPLANAAMKQADAKDVAGAIAALRLAQAFFPASAFAPYNLGVLFSGEGQFDSAAAYFGKAAATSLPDSTEARTRASALFNQGVVLMNAKRTGEAVPVLERYVREHPSDIEAKKALAQAYRATSQDEKARALDAETGVSTAAGPVLNEGLAKALDLYKAKNYAEAAPLLEAIAAAEPTNVTALGALSNSYLALKDGPKLAAAAARLSEVEPLNRDALMLLREGYRMQKDSPKANAVSERILTLPASVSVTALNLAATSARLVATATGVEALDLKTGKPLPPRAVTLVFELTDKAGRAIATQEVSVPALAAGQKQEFTVEGKGEGILAYRYKVK